MALIVAIDKALAESRNREEFISCMNLMGYGVNWTDTRKHITYTTPEGKKCRDIKLHDKKYLKEVMEYRFSKVEEYRVGEAEQVGAVEESAAPAHVRNARNPKTDGKFASSSKSPIQATDPSKTGNEQPKQKTFKDMLEGAKARAKQHNEERDTARADSINSSKRVDRVESR
jgi:hypothetical protein